MKDNNKPFDNNSQRNNVDPTLGGVDRTTGVDRTHGVDRTGGVDRTRGVDRSLGVDRTAGVDRTRSVDRTASSPAARRAENHDYFPGLKDESGELTSNSAYDDEPQAPTAPVQSGPDETAEQEVRAGLGFEDLSSSADGIRRAELDDNFDDAYSSDAGRQDGYDLYHSSYGDEMENLSSSSPHGDVEMHQKKKKKHLLPLPARKALHKVGKVALTAFLIFIIVGCIVTTAFAVYVFSFVDGSMDDYNLYELTLNYTSVVYVKDATYQGKDKDDVKWLEYETLCYENRKWVGINDVNQNVVYAFIAAEDERFYKHKGIDWKRTVAAFANMFLHFWDTEQGGSTITQQLVKNLTKDEDHSSMRKIREIMRARTLEDEYAKDTIMECYINVVYFNNNCYGIEAAAEYYFGKSADKLTIAECAAIAAITKSPSGYDPYKKPENNKSRRNWIIKNMHEIYKIYNGERGITEKERDEALKQEVKFVDHSKKSSDTSTDSKSDSSEKKTIGSGYSWFTDALVNQVVADLQAEKGYSKEAAEMKVFTGGYKIYATLDTKVQDEIDKVFTNDDYWAKVSGTEQKAQGAITVMDYSGHVVGLAGGRGEKTGRRELVRATQSLRQPGSTMKPIGCYAPALEDNMITWSTKVENTRYTVGGVTFKNDSNVQTGPVTIQTALQHSYNLVAARVLNKYGAQKSYDFVTSRFGITTLVKSETINGKEYSDINISGMALGGSTHGITTLEECAAYATFGNGGKYYKPTLYTLIQDQNKKTVLKYSGEPTEALGEDTAYIMNEMLQTGVNGGTGSAARIDGWEVFGKTGTTSDNKDRWFAGGTPYYVASCWFGCDQPVKLRLNLPGNPAIRLWQPIMKAILADKEKITFTKPDTVKQAHYCASSGAIAGEHCAVGGTGYYKTSYAPVCSGKHGGSSTGSSGASTSSAASSVASSETPSSEATSSTGSETSSTASSATESDAA